MKKEAILYILLIGIALLVPTISFAGVSLIYPDSTFTTDVNTSPPITWDQGDDYAHVAVDKAVGSEVGYEPDKNILDNLE